MTWQDSIRNADCTACPLHIGAEHVCLVGTGKQSADIMIIGEAPGAREDESHQAFVGPAGQLLNQVLGMAGIERDDCYITNVAKCRPPDNRTPERSEIKTCVEQYLGRELDAVKPKHVLLLGNSALMGVTGRSGITKHHGSVYESNGTSIMATVHPALVLRNPRWAKPFAADLVRFGRMTRGEETRPQSAVKIIRRKSQLAWLRAQLMRGGDIAFDIETWVDDREVDAPYVRPPGQDWHGDESFITCIGFTWQEGLSAVVPLWHTTPTWQDPQTVLEYLQPALENPAARWSGHNGKFDVRWMRSKGIKMRLHFDTMLAAHMVDENRPKNLESLVQTELGGEPYKLADHEKKRTFFVPLKRLCVYNGKDTDYTYRLKHRLADQLREEPRVARVFMKLMMPASEALTDIERYGVYVDTDRLLERRKECEANRGKLHAYINQFWSGDAPINLNAPQQVGRLLFEDLQLPIIEKTKKGANSTKESVLLELASQGHKVPTAIIKWRKWNGYITRYLDPWRYEWMDDAGRIHCTYKLFGTVTGRLSGEGGIQQVPRDPLIRSVLGAEPGWTFLQADYSQVELRIAAMLANEKRMLGQFQRKEDVHLARAAKMTKKPPKAVAKEERKKAKAVNFGYVYGMGAKKFVSYAFENYDVRITQEEAQADRDGFFEDYPALRTWHERQRRLARRYHRVQSPIGRVRHLSDVLSGDKEVRAEAERQAINSPVQSLASDLMLLSLIQLHEKLPADEARIVGTVHDSILFEVRDDCVERWAPVIKETMEDMSVVRRKFGAEITVPIIADIEVGTHWGEGKPWPEAA
jgi:uracil-DNA glycosylase family 4